MANVDIDYDQLIEWTNEHQKAIMTKAHNMSKEELQQKVAKLTHQLDRSSIKSAFDLPIYSKMYNERLAYKSMLSLFELDENQEKTKSIVETQKQKFDPLFQTILYKIDRFLPKITYLIKQADYYSISNPAHSISSYSRGLLLLTDWMKSPKNMEWLCNSKKLNVQYHVYGNSSNAKQKMKDNARYFMSAAVNTKKCIMLSKRADCLWKLKKYDKCLRDINKIISLCIMDRDRIEDQKAYRFIELTQYFVNAASRRSDLFLKVGNLAMGCWELTALTSATNVIPFDYGKTIGASGTNKLHTLIRVGIDKYPCSIYLKKWRYRNFPLKFNKISRKRHGWNKLTAKVGTITIPKKNGHVMIEYNSSIFVWGGSCISLGGAPIPGERLRDTDKQFCFFQVDIDINNNSYHVKKLPFPDQMMHHLFGYNLNHLRAKVVAGIRCKNKMILFGGSNYPFINVLEYNFDAKQWKRLRINGVPKFLKKCFMINEHTIVCMNNTMYVFGGNVNGWQNETNLFCSLNLVTKKWKIITKHNALNVEKGNIVIPGSRTDHIMWKDSNRGRKGSIFIGFGNHFREKLDSEIHRSDVWRYDIYDRKWYEMNQHGNTPVYRSETAFTESKNNGIITFGGYSSMLSSFGLKHLQNGEFRQYSYFGDCYEYLSNQRKWIMIQSKVFPPHRAYAAMCLLKKKNVLCLLGGYHGGTEKERCVFEDLWILDTNCLRKSMKNRQCLKICGYARCDETENDMKLFKCKGSNFGKSVHCSTLYCSRWCQKRDWISRHRLFCKQV